MTITRRKEEPVATVLLVHGDARVSERLQFMLTGGGFEISVAADNDEAIARLRRCNPDVVLIDLGLAVSEASEFAEMLRDGSVGRRIPFIALSDGPPAQGSRSALDIGAEECLSRPFSPPDILLRIRRTLERLEENRSLALSNAELSGAVRRVQATQDETRKHLEDRVVGIRSIIDFNQAIDPTLDRAEVRRLTLRQIGALFETPGISLFERSGRDSAWFVPTCRQGVSEARVENLRIPIASEFMRILSTAGRPLRLEEFERIPGTAWEVGVLTAAGFAMAAPLVIRRESRGFLAFSERAGGESFAPADLDSLSLIASSLAHMFEVGRARDEERQRGIQSLSRLVDLIEAVHPFLAGHSRRVSRLVTEIGRRSGFSEREVDDLVVAAHLHDVGYSFLSPEILSRPGPLLPAEWDEVRRHPFLGAQIATDSGWPESVALTILHHHEAWSGDGYPSGLEGENIPVGARILAVAEAFDGMASPRPHRGPKPPEEIEKTLKAESGTRYDGRFVDVLLAMMRNEELRPARQGGETAC